MVSSHAAEATPAAAAVVTSASSSGVALRCGGSASIGAASWGSHGLLVQQSVISGSLDFQTPYEFEGKPVVRRAHLLTLVAA